MNYDKIGLKCGLEIHQQLDTSKLFCNCPSLLRNDEPEFEVKRKLHAVAGESGEIDIAAAHEADKNREFLYQSYDTTCLVELDEEPPHSINEEALEIGLQIALLLNCKIIPTTQIMRKTVIDGSNTSGFQRTVLIAQDGYVETEYGRVGIDSVCLEEDSARIISRGSNPVYRLDRLGIPLVEIATAPDIKHPEQAKEVALFLGDILRSCRVRRGIGTIRQDVNVSIAGGARNEIKGFQDPSMFVKTIDEEIKRQQNIIFKKKKVEKEVRKALPDGKTEFLRPMPGAARMYPETDLPLLKISRDKINAIKKNLPKLRSEYEEDLKKLGLQKDMIKLLIKESKLEEFKELLKTYNNPSLVAKILLIFLKEIAKKNNVSIEKISELLNEDVLSSVLEAVKNKEISVNDIKHVLSEIVSGKSVNEALSLEKLDAGEIEEKIVKIIKSKPGLNSNAYMGLVMKEFRGKISGKEAMDIINKHVK